jgi:hypothetical protein
MRECISKLQCFLAQQVPSHPGIFIDAISSKANDILEILSHEDADNDILEIPSHEDADMTETSYKFRHTIAPLKEKINRASN